jgi:hypothetical protein
VSNITEVSRPTLWKPGQSGNLNGRPVGARRAFSVGFYRDLAEVFAKHGRAAMEKTAIDQPSVFFGVCARLLPAETRLTIEAGLAGGLDPGDGYCCARSSRLFGLAFRMLLTRDQAKCSNACYRRLGRLMPSSETVRKVLKIRTVLFARAKFVNDITGRFHNRMAKSLDFEF